jgi:LAO/AO transport system ATPase
MLESLLQRYRAGERLALSRLLSMLARGEHAAEILRAVPAPVKPALVVAVTGGAGVGKSSLVGRLLEVIRREGLSVAVLACDPQSPLSGGALLGDRFRMTPGADDEGVFIRSLAAAGGQGALARHLDDLVRLLEGFGFGVVLVETVGAGQGDTAARDLADVVVLLLQPETGDDLQWEKAGVLEVADLLVLHKADLPGAENVEAQVKAALMLGDRPAPPVLRVSSRSGKGVGELWQSIRSCQKRRRAGDAGAELLRVGQEVLAARFAEARRGGDEALAALAAEWRDGSLKRSEAARRLYRLLGIG